MAMQRSTSLSLNTAIVSFHQAKHTASQILLCRIIAKQSREERLDEYVKKSGSDYGIFHDQYRLFPRVRDLFQKQ